MLVVWSPANMSDQRDIAKIHISSRDLHNKNYLKIKFLQIQQTKHIDQTINIHVIMLILKFSKQHNYKDISRETAKAKWTKVFS